jgi:predicted component of type VI protein secretion system
MQSGPTAGQRFELARRSLIVGRDPVCDLAIDDVEVSRRHARLLAQGGGYTVEDLGSTNGTFVNGERISGIVALKPGDSLRLGDQVTMLYELEMADEAETRNLPSQPVAVSRAKPAAQPVESPALAAEPAFVPHDPMPDDLDEPALPRRERRKGVRIALFTQPWFPIAAVVVFLGVFALAAFLWYVDANYLWCDVFGGLIPACQ